MDASAAARDADEARALARLIAECIEIIAPRLAELGPTVHDVVWHGEHARSFKDQFAASLPGLSRPVGELQALERDLLLRLRRQAAA